MARIINVKKQGIIIGNSNVECGSLAIKKDKSVASLSQKNERKQKKKSKKLAKWIINLLVICSLVVAVTVISVIAIMFAGGETTNVEIDYNLGNPHSFVGLAVSDALDKEEIDVSKYEDDKELAEFLYATAGEKAKNADNMTAYNDGWLSMVMGSSPNLIDIDSVIMKTQDEYFSIIYHLKNSVPILDSFIGAAIAKTTDVITTERMYATKNSNVMKYQKVKNNEYDENGVPHAVWDSTLVDIVKQNRTKPVFNSSQECIYEITRHIMTADTLTQAKVTHNKQGGYYEVVATYDHTNPDTYVNSIEDIQTGTGDKNAYYTQITAEFTVWENGSFRSFFLNEKWSAKMIIDLSFELQTNWLFSYDIKDCDMDTYPDAVNTAKALS